MHSGIGPQPSVHVRQLMRELRTVSSAAGRLRLTRSCRRRACTFFLHIPFAEIVAAFIMVAMAQSLTKKLEKFPRVGISRAGTQLEPMQRLSDHLGGPRLWVKREDMTGTGFGGNKLRKLDYILHDTIASGADTAIGSRNMQRDPNLAVRLLVNEKWQM